MPLPSIESLLSGLDRTCMDALGDSIQYSAAGAAYATVRGYVDHREAGRAFDNATAMVQDIIVVVLRADVPVKPGGAARVALPQFADRTFQPVNARTDESGTHWEFEVREVAGG